MGMFLAACSGAAENGEGTGTEENGTAESSEGDATDEGAADDEAGGNITLAYVNWDSEIASHHVLQKVLEDEGFEVELLAVDNAPMWQGVADGSADATAAAWLPATHAAQYDEFGDQVVDLGPNLEGAKIGMVVPTYVDIDSIEEVNDNADKFNGQIIGIEPGAGVMLATEDAIEAYGMSDMELVSSSSAGMAAELQKAYNNEEWIAVTGWTPHWKFSKFDLKYLEDPKGSYGEAEAIHTIVREGLEEDMPRAYEILDNFYWEPVDMEEVMLKIQEGMDPEDAAAEWVEANPDKVQEWVGE
ncbi:glycine betaine ABC transporter substrate-binding protein [Novibacillus thermophilus]|uniref:Glycine/betaine ABC transporter substrate-binding protein n=1 Tax=Novibacillus thermophilus TaxID=1471761 RepID=A0A1U9KBL9_9BACL|nr:glycine/betaine ABC transporter substrate-binding protein [Novibacillus thermophilus]